MGGPLHRLPADRGARRVTDVETALVGIDAARAVAGVLEGIALRTPLVPFGRFHQ